MKKYILFLSLYFAITSARAQKLNFDSLVNLAISKNQVNPVGSPSNPDSLLKKLPFTKSPAARIRLIYDIVLLDNGELNPNKALYYHHKILDETRKYHDRIGEAVILSELGYTIAQTGDDPEGLKMIIKALDIAQSTGNNQAIGIVYDNLGVCYFNDVNLSISYYKKALKFSLAGGDYLFACAETGNIANSYHKKNNPDSARYFLFKSIELALLKSTGYTVSRDIMLLGELETDRALRLKYYKESLRLSFASHDVAAKSSALLLIATVYQGEGKLDSALFYAKKAYIATNDIFLSRRVEPARLLAGLYKGGNADSALKYSTIYYTLRDSMFSINKMKQSQSLAFAEEQKQQEQEARKKAYQATARLYFLSAIVIFLFVLAFVFWRNNRQKQKANHLLHEQKEEIESQRDNLGRTLEELKLTQNQLIQREKMASLGELTAGIAHEIQNPLNFVNNFSEVNKEMLEELKAESEKPKAERDELLETGLINDLIENESKINQHGKRADAIVKGMLQHSKTSTGAKEPTNINALADEYMRLAYHGMQSKDRDFNAVPIAIGMVTNFDAALPMVNVIPQDIGRVLLNLFNNAFYAVNKKLKTAGADYKPEVSVSTSFAKNNNIIKVKDNGNGIPNAIKDKIMQPFFTTKPTGEGTGLGLSLSYDIVVKGHGGSITVDTKEGEFTEITIILPIN